MSIVNQLHTINGTRIIEGPTWIIPSTRTRKLNRPAAGTPATSKPIPARSACRIAMPMTPRETLRIVAPVRSTNSSPRLPPHAQEHS